MYNGENSYGTQQINTGRGSGLSDFMQSNSLVAKIAYLLLVIFIFVIVLQLSMAALFWLMSPSSSPHIFDGMVDGKQLIVVPQDPSSSGSVTINRSVNGVSGIEFTWSVWIFIDDLQYQSGTYRHIFHKGNDTLNSNGLNFPNNAPGLYIAPNTNALVVMMNTYDVINQETIIPDIPINKWVNVIIRCRNTTMDVYINGLVTKSVNLLGVPKQNYGDVYVAMNGGFSGYVSNLWYYNYALGATAIQNLVKNGPNTTMVGSNAINMKNPNYLSLRWYFYGNGDQFNP
jgi:hypothetical protein